MSLRKHSPPCCRPGFMRRLLPCCPGGEGGGGGTDGVGEGEVYLEESADGTLEGLAWGDAVECR